MNLIIVEGPDGSGKTTLCRRLRERFYSPLAASYRHHPPYLQIDRIAPIYLESILPKFHAEFMVMDRSWLSEPIYTAAMRDGDPRVRKWERRMLERVALTRGAIVINCLPPYEEAKRNWAKSPTEYVEGEERYRQVYNGYSRLNSNTHLLVFNYDYTMDPEARRLIEEIESSEEVPDTTPEKVPGIGHWYPGYVTLLVGDRTGGSDPGYGLPFISWSGCSPWLARLLDEGNVREAELFWINHRDQRGHPIDAGFLQDLAPDRVIALGWRAEQWCRNNYDHKIVSVPHPQYWRRFRKDEIYRLTYFLNGGD